MKSFKYVFGLLIVMLALASCEDEIEDNTDPEVDYGELKADFKVVNIEGEEITTFDIGDKIFLIDVSEGRPDSRQWDVEGAIPDESEKRNFAVAYPRSGAYSVGLTVNRSSDDESDSIKKTDLININWIPVSAGFTTNILQNRGKCYIKLGDYVNFFDQSTGMPGEWDWSFEGGSPDNGQTSSVRIQYREMGEFDVQLVARRDDGGGKYVSDTKNRSNFVIVEERFVEVQLARYSSGVATLTFSDPMTITDADALKKDIVATAKNDDNTYPLTVSSVNMAVNDAYSIVLNIEGDIYQDDELILTMNNTSSLYDSTLLTVASPFNTPCDAVGFDKENILDPEYVGFENPNGAINNAYCVDYFIVQTAEDNSFTRSTEEAYNGEASMRFMDEVPKAGNTGKPLYGMNFSDYTLEINSCKYLPAGEYMLYQPVFIEKGSDIKSFTFIIADRLDWSPWVTVEWDMADLPRGRWVVMRTKITIVQDLGTQTGDRSAGTRSTHQVDGTPNEGVTGEQIFYIDGLSMVPLTNERPQ